MEEITLKGSIAILRRGLWLIIFIPIIVALLAGTYLYLYAENRYTAETKLYVLIDYGDTMGDVRYDVSTSTSFVGDYQQLIMTHEVLSTAAKMLGAENFDALDFNIYSQENTRVICLSVTGEDPSFCVNAANTISEVFIDYLATITQKKCVSIASKALMPSEPSGPNRILGTSIALVGTILLVAGLLIANEKMNTTLRTSEDVDKFLKVPVLAKIVGYKKEMNKFMSQKGTNKPLYHFVSCETREGIKTLSMNLQFASDNDTVKTLAVTSAVPNEGKSTIAIMLATELVDEGKRVLLCDMDFMNPSLGRHIGVRNRIDISDVLKGNAKIEKVLTNAKGLLLVDSYYKRVLLSNVVQSTKYQQFINAVRNHFDYVIIDTPPIGYFIDSTMLARIADKTLLVIASGRVERSLGKEIVDQLQKANASIIGVALNFINNRYNRSGRNVRRYKKYCYNRFDESGFRDNIST